MPRANRYFLPDHVWHITHRCHKKEFLLKFAKDRANWIKWLFEAKKRYGLEVLNYAVTSNHVHLLVYSDGRREVIPRSIQLIAGRTAQEYNNRKKRKGAFWEDRYHATAVDTDDHLIRCLIYIDLNMVRAGVVNHPAEWKHGGYHELIDPAQRYRIIARDRLVTLLGFDENMSTIYEGWIQASLAHQCTQQSFWTDSIAVGGRAFVERVKELLAGKVSRRHIRETEDRAPYSASESPRGCRPENAGVKQFNVADLPGSRDSKMLREPEAAYNAYFGDKKGLLSTENGLFWDVYSDMLGC